MNQRDLYRQISKTTGESVRAIAAMGFGLVESEPPETEPQTIDWDELDSLRHVPLLPQRRLPALA
jgi:hypothetical protein